MRITEQPLRAFGVIMLRDAIGQFLVTIQTPVYDNPCYTPIAIVQERRMAEPLPWDEVKPLLYYSLLCLLLFDSDDHIGDDGRQASGGNTR